MDTKRPRKALTAPPEAVKAMPLRLRRFERVRVKPPLVMQPRDVELVRIVSQNRFISADDLRLLVGGSVQGLTRRLRTLFDNGYIDRPRRQLLRGNHPMVYALAEAGARLISDLDGRVKRGDWSEKNRRVRLRYLEHALMISRLQTAIRHASQSGGQVLVEQWLPDGAISVTTHVQHDRGPQKVPVRPDAFFMLRALNKTPGRVHCCLEADRSSMPLERFETKLRGYWQFFRSGEAAKTLHAKHFLVVTVTRSEERARHLIEVCRSVTGHGSRMFLFGCESDFLPSTRCVVFDKIWKTPADNQLHSLLE